MMKFVLLTIAVLATTAVSVDVLNNGPVAGVEKTVIQVTSSVGGALGDILGIGEKVCGVPSLDLYRYFAVVHGLRRVAGQTYCTCPNVYRGQYPNVQSGLLGVNVGANTGIL